MPELDSTDLEKAVDSESLNKVLTQIAERVQIDPDFLDKEVMEQPQIFHDIAVLAARLASIRDQLKDQLKKVGAQQSITHRRALEEEGGRVTEAIIQAKVDTDPKFLAAKEQYYRQHMIADKVLALKEAIVLKGYMLKEMANLYSSGYFTGSSASGKAKESLGEAATESRRKKINSKRDPLVVQVRED